MKASVEIKDWRPKGVQKRVVVLSSSGLVTEQGQWGNSTVEGKEEYITFTLNALTEYFQSPWAPQIPAPS